MILRFPFQIDKVGKIIENICWAYLGRGGSLCCGSFFGDIMWQLTNSGLNFEEVAKHSVLIERQLKKQGHPKYIFGQASPICPL